MTTNTNNNKPTEVTHHESRIDEVTRMAQTAPKVVTQAADSIHALPAEADRTRSFGRRIWVLSKLTN